MRSRSLVCTGLVLAAFLLLSCRGKQEDSELAPLAIGGDFSLQGSEGKRFALSSLRGRTVLLFFGYTTCPDVCPTTLARLSKVYRELESDGVDNRVATVFVSVDPERDTPDKLKQYLTYFAVRATGVTGPPGEIDAVVEKYGASYEKVPVKSAAGYLINHSMYVYLIDGQGRVRHLFRHEDPPERIAALVKRLVEEDDCQVKCEERS